MVQKNFWWSVNSVNLIQMPEILFPIFQIFLRKSKKFQRHRRKNVEMTIDQKLPVKKSNIVNTKSFVRFCSAWKSVAHSKYQVSTCATDNCLKIFQQDWAPSHSSRITQDHLQECTPIFVKKREWPPKSLDCNPKLRKSHIWRRLQRQGRKVHCAGTERCYCIGSWERITLEQIRSCLSSWEKDLCIRQMEAISNIYSN